MGHVSCHVSCPLSMKPTGTGGVYLHNYTFMLKLVNVPGTPIIIFCELLTFSD